MTTDEQDLTAQRGILLELGVAADRIYLDHGLTGSRRIPVAPVNRPIDDDAQIRALDRTPTGRPPVATSLPDRLP